MSHQARNGKYTSVLCCRIDNGATKKTKSDGSSSGKTKKDAMMFQVYRPNTGLQFRTESLAEIEKKYKKVQSDEAEKHWTQQFDASVNTCSHAYWRGNCRNVTMGHECEVSDDKPPIRLQITRLLTLRWFFRWDSDDVSIRFSLALCWLCGLESREYLASVLDPQTKCR